MLAPSSFEVAGVRRRPHERPEGEVLGVQVAGDPSAKVSSGSDEQQHGGLTC